MANGAASALQILLNRASSQESWGFRLQGGSDFPIPLSIQSVTENSIACKSGLAAGDAVVKINEILVTDLEHEEAKRQIVASGNQVLLTVQREGVDVWKPRISLLSGGGANEPQATKYSLAAQKQEVHHIGSQFNVTPKPFFAGKSETFQSGNPSSYSQPNAPSYPNIRPVRAPVANPNVVREAAPQAIICHICGNNIIGVFPMVSGHPVHVECFTCCRCGKNLKNQGYHLLNGQLFCDQHAQQ